MWSVRFVAVLALLAVLAGGALAATPEFPNKPMRYITGSAPGGASDLIARTIGPALSEGLGVQIVIDNRPGAGNTIGAEIAARAAPDGYTLFGCNIASLAVEPRALPEARLRSRARFRADRPDRQQSQRPHRSSLASGDDDRAIHRPCESASRQAQLRVGRHRDLTAAFDGVVQDAGRHQHRPCPVQGRRAGAGRPDGGPCRSDVFDRAVGALGGAQRQGPCARRDVEAARSGSAGRADHRRVGHAGLRGHLMAGFVHAPQACRRQRLRGFAPRWPRRSRMPDTRKRLADQGFQLHLMPAEKFAAFIRAERAKWAKVVKDDRHRAAIGCANADAG